MERKCLKCQHVANVPGLPTDECPQCGAIYTKVEAYLQSKQSAAIASLQKTPANRRSQSDARAAYVEDLRNETLYPTARWSVNLVHTIFTVLCAIGVIGGLFALTKSLAVGLTALCVSILLWLTSRIAKEMSQMIIDLCDASVRTAFKAEQQNT